MKVLAVCGSPRNGNTEAMLKRLLDGAKSVGAEIELVLLRQQNTKMCGGCQKCTKTHSCHLQDDMQELYGKVFAADALVLGSPNYFNNVSALMKNFFDRFCPYWEKKLKGKKAALVCVGAAEDDSLKHCENALKQFVEICSMELVGSIKSKAEKPREVLENKKAMQECFELGKRLASGK